MKKYICLALITAAMLGLIPYSVCKFSLAKEKQEEDTINFYEQYDTFLSDSQITIFNHKENRTETMNFRDYIIGVVAAEMPVEFHSEALSAGAAAAATLARSNLRKGADPELMGAVISTDSTKHQAFLSIEEMKTLWGESFEKYYEKLCKAVDKSIDYSITYDDELIIAAYHAISPGTTESAENIWISEIPYLVSVESPGDTLSPGYLTKLTLSHEEFRKKTEEQGTVLSENSAEWIGTGEYTQSGTLIKIRIGNKDFTGKQLREIFSLRSPSVTIENTADGIIMTTKGYGHGVGMSQYGADYYARQGYTWQEIITHYYPGVSLSKEA